MNKMIACECKSEFQDGKYGKGIRVHNSMQKPAKPNLVTGYRCTVCGKAKPI